MGAICATPPHLEGAPLLQIPVDSLNCDGANEYDNSEVLEQLDIISKQSNVPYSKDLSDTVSVIKSLSQARKNKKKNFLLFSNLKIALKNVHLSEDYGIILTWSVNLRNDEFKCDAVFVYRETNVHEILLDNSPVSKLVIGTLVISLKFNFREKFNSRNYFCAKHQVYLSATKLWCTI